MNEGWTKGNLAVLSPAADCRLLECVSQVTDRGGRVRINGVVVVKCTCAFRRLSDVIFFSHAPTN